MSKTWQRARQPEQKEVRSTAILKAAAKLLDSDGLLGTGLNAIAREAGISKANMYRYFESREAVLMELLLQEHAGCMQELERGFLPWAGSNNADAIAEVIARSFSHQARYCVLISALAGILEHNVSPETIAQFKRELMRAAEPALEALVVAVPKLSREVLFDFLKFISMAASGVWPHCHPSSSAQMVLKQPEFAHFRLSFGETLQRQARALLVGYLSG